MISEFSDAEMTFKTEDGYFTTSDEKPRKKNLESDENCDDEIKPNAVSLAVNQERSSNSAKIVHNSVNNNNNNNNNETPRPFTNFCIENILNSDFSNSGKKRGKYSRTCSLRRYEERDDSLYSTKSVTNSGSKKTRNPCHSQIDELLMLDSRIPGYINRSDSKSNGGVSVLHKGYGVRTSEQNDSRLVLDLSQKHCSRQTSKSEGNDSESRRERRISERSDEDSSRNLWPAWVFCTRYSDRPSSGPRMRKPKNHKCSPIEKRPRTAFSKGQLDCLKVAFETNQYLTEETRVKLSDELHLSPSQIKIWFQNKRAKLKKSNGIKNSLAMELYAQGLYNHTTANK